MTRLPDDTSLRIGSDADALRDASDRGSWQDVRGARVVRDAVFLDDKVTNIRAAQAVGLHAITYKNRLEFAGKEVAYGLPPIPTAD